MRASDNEETGTLISRLITLLLACAGAVLLVALALANRHWVTLKLDPINPDNPIIFVPLPFYVFLFGAVILGIALGGMATWMSQGKWRYTARQRTQEALRWKAEAERLSRERDDTVTAARQLVSVNR